MKTTHRASAFDSQIGINKCEIPNNANQELGVWKLKGKAEIQALGIQKKKKKDQVFCFIMRFCPALK